jgi:type IV pilus assembly protein PilO
MATVDLDTILKLPKPQKMGILIGIVALLTGLYVYLYFLPKSEEIQQKRDLLTKKQAELAEQKKIVANLPKFQKELSDLEGKLKEALSQLPDKKEIPRLLADISQQAIDSGLEILLFKPKPEAPKEFYAEIPVEMELLGNYHEVALFFDRVGRLPRIVNIKGITMKKPTDRDGKIVVTGSCTATTFKFLEESAGGATKKKK